MEYPDLSALPADLQLAVISHGSLNVYRMVMHSPGLAPGLLALGDAVLQANSLPPHWRELAILRVGHAYGAAYVVVHHERIADSAGLARTAVDAAATGFTGGLPAGEAAILAWTDRLLADHTLDHSQQDDDRPLLTVNQLADLVVTVGFYQLVCNLINTFDVTTDGETPPS
ncbi:MAG: 4-carboxymuconolactone decarboxylase [Micromonosporaceae bacterium]|jgi:alkylhydroperoxidase family enzyme|nr:4-carboxymuconolactone decarboxylase [Micromonosporaceae bacterium]